MRAIGLEDGKNLASFFNISFPLWLRQSHVLHAPRYETVRVGDHSLKCFICKKWSILHYIYQSNQNFLSRIFNMLFSMLRPFLSDSVRDNVVFHSGDLTTIRSYIRYFSYFIQLIKHFKLIEKKFFLLILEDMIRWDPWITSTMCLSSARWNLSSGKYSSLDIFEENVQMSYWEEWKCSLFFLLWMSV